MWTDPVMKDLARHLSQHERHVDEQDRIEYDMVQYFQKAHKRAEKIMPLNLVEDFLRLLACAYKEEKPEAFYLARQLLLTEKHIAAINEDYEAMAKIVLAEDELRYMDNLEAYALEACYD